MAPPTELLPAVKPSPRVRRFTVNETFSYGGLDITARTVRQDHSWAHPGQLWTGVELEIAPPALTSTLEWSQMIRVQTTQGELLPSSADRAKVALQLAAGKPRKFVLNFYDPEAAEAVSITLPDGRVIPLSPTR